ncbi:transglycosylase SLT domain-containing protein [Paracidovorax sp. MALMAid1276]|uniref:lytic transglycosylase domain-containing protein n=1 Tax=Paracidovorax sp. MALMAid1276 TaxID=3411631 RepID=UPI003B9D67D8
MTASGKIVSGVRTFVADVTEGFLEITHNSFALIGLAVAFVVIALTARPDLRQAGEEQLMDWLRTRQLETLGITVEPEASERATAANPKDLPKAQAAVTFWLSKKYRVAPEPLSVLVAEAYDIGERTKIDPTLILAIMAIESSFNPFAQSAVGAQGLMQVMTRVHTDKYESFGGHFAAFDPVTNLRVGVKVLQECIARAGSVEGGLRYYVGAANLPDDGGYAAKVLAEHFRLRQVANGRAMPTNPPPTLSAQAAPQVVPAVAPAAAPAPAPAPLAVPAPAAPAGEKVALLSGL